MSTAYRHANRFFLTKVPTIGNGLPGRELGWSGVALKTCKTQTGALLSACWAKAHGMRLMVQDLTNPMLAQIPRPACCRRHHHGVETNAMQFYPDASGPEATVHPGSISGREAALNSPPWKGLAWVIVWRISNDAPGTTGFSAMKEPEAANQWQLDQEGLGEARIDQSERARCSAL